MQSPPSRLRETFELFRFYRPDVGIHRLLEDAGVADMSPRQVYHAVHDRPPDSLEAALSAPDRNALEHFIGAVTSREFRLRLGTHLLRAFPEKSRLFFVHIPKTAGVDLATRLISRMASFNTRLADPDWPLPHEELFLTLKHLALELACSDTIFFSGHTHIGAYQSWDGNGIRMRDRVFTVVRAPMEQLLSQVNYVLTRIFSDEDPIQADTAGWRREFDVRDLGIRDSRPDVLRLARRILRDPGVVVPNVICAFLGGGRYETALVQTVAHDLEVIELSRLDAWCAEHWGISKGSRMNASEKFVALRDFSDDDVGYAHSIIEDDTRYFHDVLAAYERTGGTSVKGSEILRPG